MPSNSHYVSKYNKDDPSCDETRVHLGISSELGSVSPSEMSALLKIVPDHTREAGKPVIGKRSGREHTPKKNAWLLSSEKVIQSKDLRDHLDWILSVLTPHKEALLQLQQMPGVTMWLTCVWWAAEGGGGPVLWPKHMRGIADLNLECAFDFQDYSDDDEPSDAASKRDS